MLEIHSLNQYYGGSHIPDWTVVNPVFVEGKPRFFNSVRGHVNEVGGCTPGGYNTIAREIWHEGFRVPPGQVYSTVESPRGELGAHIVSDGGTRPYRVHFREPSFINLQGTATMAIGGMIADVIASVASIDPVMGGCDR